MPTQDNLNVKTKGDLGPLGMFILSLAFDQRRRQEWIKDPKSVIVNSGLSTADKNALLSGNPARVQKRIVDTSGGEGTRIWICIWIKLP